MIGNWYFELEKKFNDIKCRNYVIMPNHFHCIIQNVGADLCVCPNNKQKTTENVEADLRVCPKDESLLNNKNDLGEHIGSPLQSVIQWFKTMTTNEYIRNVKENKWERFNGKLWQRNYFEHIIRNEKAYLKISQYIFNNPLIWLEDSINPDYKK